MSLPKELEPAVSIVYQVLELRIPGAHVSDLIDAAEDVVERLMHAGWLQIPTSSMVLLVEPSPDMDSGGAG